jgi:hypothetical protein
MPNLDDFVAIALTQRGDPYVFGTESDFRDPDPYQFDCSELVERASACSGVTFVDGAQNQRNACMRAGTCTDTAVWAFQKTHELAMDGIVGAKTREALDRRPTVQRDRSVPHSSPVSARPS